MLEFLVNHVADIAICLVLAVLFGFAIRYLVKRKGNACGCGSGGCAGCSGCSQCAAMAAELSERKKATGSQEPPK